MHVFPPDSGGMITGLISVETTETPFKAEETVQYKFNGHACTYI